MATRSSRRRCSVCRRVGHDRRAHRSVRGRRLNPDFFRDKYGRVHPVRTPIEHVGNYDFWGDGVKPPGKRSPYRSGPRGGYSHELPGREGRGELAKMRRDDPSMFESLFGTPKPTYKRRGKTDTGAAERLARGKTRAEKEHARSRRVALRGY
jgi:hypothetical protein